MNKYIILTNKVNEFRTEVVDGIEPLESYDYYFYSKKLANYTIARLTADEVKVKLVEEDDTSIINRVPARLFEQFDSVEEVRKELKILVTFGNMDTKLEKVS